MPSTQSAVVLRKAWVTVARAVGPLTSTLMSVASWTASAGAAPAGPRSIRPPRAGPGAAWAEASMMRSASSARKSGDNAALRGGSTAGRGAKNGIGETSCAGGSGPARR